MEARQITVFSLLNIHYLAEPWRNSFENVYFIFFCCSTPLGVKMALEFPIAKKSNIYTNI